MSLRLPEFKNLRDFEVEFAEDYPLSVLVGKNGTGKSNVLEALTLIFRDFDLGRVPSFEFSVLYSCRGFEVRAECIVSGMGRHVLAVWVDGEAVASSTFLGHGGALYKPDYVFGYYSGPSNRLEEHYEIHQERFYRDLIKGHERPLRRLFYARAVHSNFVLLAFFLDDDPEVRHFLRDQLGIHDFDSVLFVMQQPLSWSSKVGDSRFWNARGTVQVLLDGLYKLALAPLRLRVKISTSLTRRKTVERLYLFLTDLDAVRDLYNPYPGPQDFFKALESTYISELIADLRIRVKVRGAGHPLTFRELSEGEQQLLLVLGLMRFTREEESLFLLDEPDTHLNPAWSVQYRSFLRTFGGLDGSSHVIMATHDPLVIAGMTRDEVRIFRRGRDGTVGAGAPWEDPRGMGVGALLTSDVYGLRSQLDLETLYDLDRKRVLAAKKRLTKSEAAELGRLSTSLAGIGLMDEDRDPEFQAFLQAKRAAEPPPDEIELGPEEIADQRRLASEILSALEDEPTGVE